MKKTWYKVVSTDGERLVSACVRVGRYRGWKDDLLNLVLPLETTYIPGEFVSAKLKGSRLFIFDDLNKAKEFMWQNNTHCPEIWECEVKKPAKVKALQSYDNIISFWLTKKRKYNFVREFEMYWTASEVKLTKKVF